MMRKIKFTWKTAFFLLLLFNVFVIIYIVWPVKESPILREDFTIEDAPKIYLETNKSDLTKLINHFIEKEYGNQTFKYYVNITNELILFGNLEVFGQNVQVQLHFQPEPLENGDLRLKQNKMSIGNLDLPVSLIMNLIGRAYQFPEWVEIKKDEEAIYLYLTQIHFENDFRIRVDEIDLKNDNITFQLFIAEDNDF